LIGFCCWSVLVAIGAIPRAPPSTLVELVFVGAVRRGSALLFVHVAAKSTLAPTSETLDQISRLLILDILKLLDRFSGCQPRGNRSARYALHDER
jgi:hypothetical protein